MELSELNRPGQRILSFVKANVVLNLLEAVCEYDEEAKKLLAGKKFTLQINAASGPKVHIKAEGGKLTYVKKPKFWPTLTLYFPKPEELNKMFGGKKAFVLPLIGGVKFASALSTFKALMARLQYYMSGKPEVKDLHRDFLGKLMLYATASGVPEVANHDPYVVPFMHHMPDGVVEVFVKGREDIAACMVKRGGRMVSGKGRSPEPSNTRLIFKDVKTLMAVLGGSVNAAYAMAMTDIVSEGNRAIMKEVFPILDRLSYYMSVK